MIEEYLVEVNDKDKILNGDSDFYEVFCYEVYKKKKKRKLRRLKFNEYLLFLDM